MVAAAKTVEATKTRELLAVATHGICLRGTYHRVQTQYLVQHGWELQSRENESPRIGVLFLNSGGDPRSASGDSAVHWADSFARSGYPSFRFDLPGLGDSDGELPEKWQDFFQLVNSGHYASFVSSLTKILMDRYQLSGVVVAGHCAGSVSAIYAAASSRNIQGVVVLDPYFFREEDERPAIRKGLSHLVTRNKVAGQLSKVYGGVKKVSMLVKGNKLPNNANMPLLRCWNQVASAGVPILVLYTQQARPRAGEFDYFRYLQSLPGGAGRMVLQFIEGANHSFADDAGREAVRRFTEEWLEASFWLAAPERYRSLAARREERWPMRAAR
jgi:pimeloyl-ACP methyl ester carboxylesterase